MGVPEPSSPLWTAVKAVHDPWPADDEVVAGAVAAAWRRGGDTVTRAAAETARAGDAARTAWRDTAGTGFHDRVGSFVTSTNQLQQHMGTLAVRAEHYSRELASAKTVITSTIAQNESTYALLGNPLLGAFGPAMRNAFVIAIASALQRMIAEKAAGLRANPDGPAQESAAVGTPAADTDSGFFGRELTPEEAAIARSVFGDSLDLSRVRVADGGPLGAGNIARTIPGLITFPGDTLSNPPPGFERWLVHELTHIWQYQRGHTVEDLLPPALAGERAYDYGGVQGLRDAHAQGKTFDQFNTEQQADIVADYYVARKTGADTSAYEPFVSRVRDSTPVTPAWPPLTYPDSSPLPR